jgi:hypothetical protein
MLNRRGFTLVLVTIVLWDLGKGAIRLWERKTWANTRPGSLSHDVADVSAVILG